MYAVQCTCTNSMSQFTPSLNIIIVYAYMRVHKCECLRLHGHMYTCACGYSFVCLHAYIFMMCGNGTVSAVRVPAAIIHAMEYLQMKGHPRHSHSTEHKHLPGLDLLNLCLLRSFSSTQWIWCMHGVLEAQGPGLHCVHCVYSVYTLCWCLCVCVCVCACAEVLRPPVLRGIAVSQLSRPPPIHTMVSQHL